MKSHYLHRTSNFPMTWWCSMSTFLLWILFLYYQISLLKTVLTCACTCMWCFLIIVFPAYTADRWTGFAQNTRTVWSCAHRGSSGSSTGGTTRSHVISRTCEGLYIQSFQAVHETSRQTIGSRKGAAYTLQQSSPVLHWVLDNHPEGEEKRSKRHLTCGSEVVNVVIIGWGI